MMHAIAAPDFAEASRSAALGSVRELGEEQRCDSQYAPWTALALAAVLWLGQSLAVAAQPADQSEKEIERYRAMISDPMSNPGFLNVDRGEALWKTARGARKVSLETCDLGEGPGKLDGAYARLPRYFKDADKVMDTRAAAALVHAEDPGSRYRRRGEAQVRRPGPHLRHGGSRRLSSPTSRVA